MCHTTTRSAWPALLSYKAGKHSALGAQRTTPQQRSPAPPGHYASAASPPGLSPISLSTAMPTTAAAARVAPAGARSSRRVRRQDGSTAHCCTKRTSNFRRAALRGGEAPTHLQRRPPRPRPQLVSRNDSSGSLGHVGHHLRNGCTGAMWRVSRQRRGECVKPACRSQQRQPASSAGSESPTPPQRPPQNTQTRACARARTRVRAHSQSCLEGRERRQAFLLTRPLMASTTPPSGRILAIRSWCWEASARARSLQSACTLNCWSITACVGGRGGAGAKAGRVGRSLPGGRDPGWPARLPLVLPSGGWCRSRPARSCQSGWTALLHRQAR